MLTFMLYNYFLMTSKSLVIFYKYILHILSILTFFLFNTIYHSMMQHWIHAKEMCICQIPFKKYGENKETSQRSSLYRNYWEQNLFKIFICPYHVALKVKYHHINITVFFSHEKYIHVCFIKMNILIYL